MKKYQSYKSSGVEWIGDIPEHWTKSKFKYVTQLFTGNSLNDEQKLQYESDNIDDIPYVSSKDINLDFRSVNYFNGLRIPKENNPLKISPKGSFLLCVEGGSSGRKMVFLDREVCFVNKLCSFYSSQNTKFQYYFIQSSNFQNKFKFSLTGLIGGVSISTLKDFDLPLPPHQEQEQIVNYLDEKTTIVDKLISTKQRKIELLKEQRSSIINEVITKGLNPNVKMKDSGVEWIGKIPESWSFVRLGVLGSFSKGKGITKDKIKEEGFPCIRNGEIYTTYNLRFSEPKSFIDETSISESIKVKKGTLFFTGDGETLEEIGKCVVYLGEEEIYVGGGINVFTPKTDKVSPIYLSYVMSSTSCVYQKSIGGKGEIVVHIYSKQLRDIQFGLPKLEEQQEIVEYLDKHTKEIDDLVSTEQKKIELLKEYRQSLISEVITGKIKVVL